MGKVNEAGFEWAIERHLLSSGYEKGKPEEFDAKFALFPQTLLRFLEATQPKELAKLRKVHGNSFERNVFSRLDKEIQKRSVIDVLRHGITDHGVSLDLMIKKPADTRNPDHASKYAQNIFSITRQVHFNEHTKQSVDLVIDLNGIPIITAELKNLSTAQSYENAVHQYKYDRDPRLPLFMFKRCIVHFALDPNLIYMTTKLAGKETVFLPFNKGHLLSAENPPNPNGHRTAYLWEDILQKDSLIEIIERFVQFFKETKTYGSKRVTKEALLFPRYHQLDVVRLLTNKPVEDGSGVNYLVQHSTGSGKSNSIAWLAYSLNKLKVNDEKRFDSIIVVSDRTVLDTQLQNTIYSIDHTRGVVTKIDRSSKQLGEAIRSKQQIIISTLQKFPFILDEVKSLTDRTYAVIIDEAHSSQGGETARKLKQALSNVELGEDDDTEDAIRKIVESRGVQPNLNFFAFTATPKQKTLELFGQTIDGTPQPHHVYSMRQAIEEGFILDVLKNYTTYDLMFRLSKKIEEDPELNTKKANRAIARFVHAHPYNISQKVEVIIEHFNQVTRKKIGGEAKAMIVAASRADVVRYYKAIHEYLKNRNITGIRHLAAFSGSLTLDEEDNLQSYTEVDINGFPEKELPEHFDADYNLLLVAEKYQTGFDQPKLHTMYVDRKLAGVKAVQTLSRLNRTYPGKSDTLVVDFANSAEEIKKAYQPYYETTMLAEETDPNRLYDLRNELEELNVVWKEDIDSFADLYYRRGRLSPSVHGQIDSLIERAVDRYKENLDDHAKEHFKKRVKQFVNLYSFASQIMPFSDASLEKFYSYLSFLQKHLPKRTADDQVDLRDDLSLEYYRLEKVREGAIELETSEKLPGRSEQGAVMQEKLDALSQIINRVNELFGVELTDADRVWFEQIRDRMVNDEELRAQAQQNSISNFKYGYKEKFERAVIDYQQEHEQHAGLFAKFFDDDRFRKQIMDLFMRSIYDKLKGE
jgi:type I restriction enzyme, R subunit